MPHPETKEDYAPQQRMTANAPSAAVVGAILSGKSKKHINGVKDQQNNEVKASKHMRREALKRRAAKF